MTKARENARLEIKEKWIVVSFYFTLVFDTWTEYNRWCQFFLIIKLLVSMLQRKSTPLGLSIIWEIESNNQL